MSWLAQGELSRESGPLEKQWERVFTRIRVIDFSDLHSVISQVVMHNVRNVTEDIEPQNFTVKVQELFLGRDSPVQHTGVQPVPFFIVEFWGDVFFKVVNQLGCLLRLGSVYRCIEISGVLINVINHHGLTMNLGGLPNLKIISINELPRAVAPQNILPGQKCALRDTRVTLFDFQNFNTVVFQMKLDHQFSYSEILKVRFRDTLFKVPKES